MQVHPEESPCGSEQLQPLGPVLGNLPRRLRGVVVARLQIRQVSIPTLGIPPGGLGAARPLGTDGEEVRHLLSRREGVEFVPEVGKVGLGADVPLVAAEEGGDVPRRRCRRRGGGGRKRSGDRRSGEGGGGLQGRTCTCRRESHPTHVGGEAEHVGSEGQHILDGEAGYFPPLVLGREGGEVVDVVRVLGRGCGRGRL